MPEYTPQIHWFLTIFGLALLVVITITFRLETSFLVISKKHRLQFILSLLSMIILGLLSLISLFHWSIPPLFTFTALMILAPLLLILAPAILYLRAKSIRQLHKDRLDEQKRLIMEVQDLIDQKKRESIREGKISRGEEASDQG
jgi:membrane-associated HD superfamily phosphohydrolase